MKIKTFRPRQNRGSLWNKAKKLISKNKENPALWKKFLIWCLWIFGAIILISTFYAVFFLPSVKNAAQLEFAQSTIIYDREALDPNEDPNDHVLYVIHGDENRKYVPLKEISPWIKKATIAIEDDQFYHHFGFDIPALVKATLNKLFGIGGVRGGSTITQQLVKNTFLSNEKTILRKYKELLLSIKMELAFTKDEILEMYLNKIPYGSNAHGIEAASQKFFGKSSRNLTIAESSILASLPQRPTLFSPYGSHRDLLMGFYEYDEATGEKIYKKGRKDLVLQRMLDEKKISFEEFKIAFSESKTLEFSEKRDAIKAPHFVFLVRQQLEEKYGKEFLKNGGFHIYTTLNKDLQNIAEKTIAEKTSHYTETYGATNVALVSIDPNNGQILAYVGGKDYFNRDIDGQVDVLTSHRQPGSSIKPLVYETAFEKGYVPSTQFFDVETDFGGGYIPRNFDNKYRGPVSARTALNSSLNIPAVKMAYLANPKNIFKNAEKLGLQMQGKPEDHGVALGIGVAEVEPLHHIASFQAFARDGSLFEVSSILEIHDSHGKILEKFDIEKVKKDGLEPEATALVREILTDETTRPTTDDFDWNILLQLENLDNGAKTGTSNRPAKNPKFDETKPEDPDDNPKMIVVPSDSWTIGFTPNLVAGVWVGNNRGEPMRAGATGLTVAAPIWKRFMTEAHQKLFEKNPAKKDKKYPAVPLEKRKINKFTGKLASDATPEKIAIDALFASYSIPYEKDTEMKKIEIDKISGRRATRFTPFFAKREKYILEMHSLKPNLPNWEVPVQEWIKKHPKFMESLGQIMDDDKKTGRNNLTSEEYENRLNQLEKLLNRRKQKDDVHNKYTYKNPPKISVLSPKNNGQIATGEVEIITSISSKFGIKEVEFYFDDQLISYKNEAPWTEKIQIPAKIESGSSHIIKIIAIDKLLNASEKEIKVKIAKDTTGPQIIFLGPLPQQKIPVNSQIDILLSVQDFQSSLKAVEILYRGASLGFLQSPPYKKTINIGEFDGKQFLTARAWDIHNNITEKSIPLFIQKEPHLANNDPEIVRVNAYREVISTNVIVSNPEKVEWIELKVTKDGTEIFSEKIDLPNVKNFIFQIPKTGSGLAKLQLETKFLNNSKSKITSKKEIKF